MNDEASFRDGWAAGCAGVTGVVGAPVSWLAGWRLGVEHRSTAAEHGRRWADLVRHRPLAACESRAEGGSVA
mgnify:CR=1 FL=1